MKHRFVKHEGWYLIPAHEFERFLEITYAETCAEDEFREDGDDSAGRKWSDARRVIRETYGKYKIHCHLSSYVFENPEVDNSDLNDAAQPAVVIGDDEDGQID